MSLGPEELHRSALADDQLERRSRSVSQIVGMHARAFERNLPMPLHRGAEHGGGKYPEVSPVRTDQISESRLPSAARAAVDTTSYF